MKYTVAARRRLEDIVAQLQSLQRGLEETLDTMPDDLEHGDQAELALLCDFIEAALQYLRKPI